VGNSVPPFLAKAVAGEIGKALGYSPVRPRKMIQLDRTNLLEWDTTNAARYYEKAIE
jgi:DNA (cytosine-5)-methyltransferase 1